MTLRKFSQRKPVFCYFLLTFFLSWGAAFALVAGKIFYHHPLSQMDGLLMFPLMILGPFVSSLVLNASTGGRQAIRKLFAGMNPRRIPGAWLTVLLIPPLTIFLVLLALSKIVSPEYSPGHFWMGFTFGILAGILEEIGWMGFAYPNMVRRLKALPAGILLGILWSLWHLPVINFLGSASPHGQYWMTYFLSFAAVMTAMRVIIAWIYQNTKSLLLCQLMHICSTGFLVAFSPSPIAAAQEPIWYFVYAAVLWILVAFLASRYGTNLDQKSV